jgi:chromosome segregation ATPase
MDETLSADGQQRIEELLRINEELAAEIRSLQAGRTIAARSAAMPAARRVGSLREERDSLKAELEASRTELERVEEHNQELGRQIHEQSNEIGRLSQEVGQLRSGVVGLMRRVRARLLDNH